MVKKSVPNIGKKVYDQGVLSFAWRAEDPDNDSLQYSIYYKGIKEANWKLLEKDYADTLLHESCHEYVKRDYYHFCEEYYDETIE